MPNFLSVLFLCLLPFCFAQFTITDNSGSVSIAVANNVVFSGSFVNNGVMSLIGTKISLYNSLLTASPTSLPASLVSLWNITAGTTGVIPSKLFRVNTKIFLIQQSDDLPSQYIFYPIVATNASDSVLCKLSNPASYLSFGCATFNSASLLNASFSTVSCQNNWANCVLKLDAFSSVSMAASPDYPDFVYDLFTVALFKIRQYRSVQLSIGDVKNANANRNSDGRVYVGVTWFFIAAGTLVLCVLSSVLQVWLYPYFTKHPLAIWLFLIFGITNACTWGGGIAGWFAATSSVFLHICTVSILYWRQAGHCLCTTPPLAAVQTQQVQVQQATPTTGADASQVTVQVEKKSEERKTDEKKSGKKTDEKGSGVIELDDEPWTVRPEPMVPTQRRAYLRSCLALIVTSAIVLGVFYGWFLPDYQVWDRAANVIYSEYQPQTLGKAAAMAYLFDGMAKLLRMEWLFKLQTDYCGAVYSQALTSDSDRRDKIYDAFISKYNIDMSIYEKPLYSQYGTVNDWFSRKIARGVRPISSPNDNSVVVSPADCRMAIFSKIGWNTAVWFKGEKLTVSELLGGNPIASVFENGGLVMARLAPADYHRTHTPVSGNVTQIYSVSGPLFSVAADAIRAQDGAIYNQRVVTIIQTAYGPVAFVAIGATCVGSVVTTTSVGAFVTKGQEISYFQFGGSTVAVVFPPNAVQWDDDLLTASQIPVEFLVRQGNRIGKFMT